MLFLLLQIVFPTSKKKRLLLVISITVTLNFLSQFTEFIELLYQEWAGHTRFIRVMPNTPAAVGQAASGIAFSFQPILSILSLLLLIMI